MKLKIKENLEKNLRAFMINLKSLNLLNIIPNQEKKAEAKKKLIIIKKRKTEVIVMTDIVVQRRMQMLKI